MKIDINEVDAIIVSTITPDMLFPSTACLIQNHFKIKNCWCFDLSAACSGFLFGLETANNLITSGKYNKIIVAFQKLIEKYEEYHRNAWPEVINGLKVIGIERMEIFRNIIIRPQCK